MTPGNPLHASSVLIDGRVLLIAGASGRGKSDLALRLIDRGAKLVADDYTSLERRGSALIASAPRRIAGRMEIRGLGIIDQADGGEGPVALLLDLDRTPERLPDEPLATVELEGVSIPALAFVPFESSAPIKAELALRRHGLGAPRA